MTRPTTAPKLLLVADARRSPGDPASAPIRRYRLARVRFNDRTAEPAARFDHLKRVYD